MIITTNKKEAVELSTLKPGQFFEHEDLQYMVVNTLNEHSESEDIVYVDLENHSVCTLEDFVIFSDLVPVEVWDKVEINLS